MIWFKTFVKLKYLNVFDGLKLESNYQEQKQFKFLS